MLDVEGLEEGKRIQFSTEKRNKTDFALWKFSPKDEKRQMEWESPWGIGFPGWHIECSAMARKFLGDTFDIHCGGIDHIPIHHTNEIAQSEACTGNPFAHYWLHGAFLEEDSGKMSKSKGEFLRLKLLIEKGYSPLDYRYMCLGTHYRKRLLFSWDVLDSAKSSFNRLRENIKRMRQENLPGAAGEEEIIKLYKNDFTESVNDDLNMPQALAVMWDMARNTKLGDKAKLDLLYDFDKVLGLDLNKVEETANGVPEEIMELVRKRNEAKAAKDFKLADEYRAKVKELGYEIIDKKDGVEVKKS
jgi:cysteinyl-tRNA synthetase